MFGYNGKTARINLSTSEISVETFSEDFARRFIGGNGFAAHFINEIVPADCEPLSEDNVAVFASGPLNGTPVWGTSRGHLAAISPLTGFFADSNFGGNFGEAFKKAGYDAVVITGKAKAPVYISIDNGEIEIKDAGDLWGMETGQAHSLLTEMEGEKVESALIGPAGENAVLYACVMCSGKRISAAGRGGMGAVLGSKNCKGLAVQGNCTIEVADEDKLKQHLKSMLPDLREKAKPLTNIGTPVLVDVINNKGKLCTRNNTAEVFEDASRINGALIVEKYKEKNIACRSCPIACGKLVSVTHGEFEGRSVKMPEFETLYSIGAMLGNGDIISIFNANAMCDEMGLDTISFGVTLSFLVECFEKGIVTEQDLGRDLSFGDMPDLASIVRIAAMKEGRLGELLAMGSERISKELGNDSYKFLYCVKGMEIAGHSARGLRNMGLGYATGTRGGSHHDTRPSYYPDDPEVDPGFTHQPEYCVKSQHNTALGDSLVICRFVQERALGTQVNEAYIPIIQSVTGWAMDTVELEKAGERIYNLERIINIKRGQSRSMDALPYRVMNEPIPEGPSKGWYCSQEDLDGQLDEYYKLRGWDSNGLVTDEKKRDLDL